ncbi:MAG TPA: CBS domain-containing protein [Anaeromyxobacteraceae bacterium]|nr:CBS domain-containing protein [Anaeromyxobacteraceae bacterium]
MPETATTSALFGDPRFIFFSDLLGRPVESAGGARLGRLADLVVASGEPYPPVESLVVKGPRGRLLFPWSAVERAEGGALTLRADAAGAPPPESPPADRIPLAEELLDRQIVDVHDAKLVRVNDLHFLEVKGQLRVAHVDVGFRGLVRRMGWQPLVDRAVRLVRPKAPYLSADQLVSWKLVQPLDRSPGRLRLEVAQRMLATLHPADLAEIMEELSRDQRTVLFERLDVETAADALEEAPTELAAQVLEEVAPEKAADILEEMAPDEAADVLSDLPGDTRQEVLAAMERPEAREVEALLAYPRDSAGGLMTPDRIQLLPDQTVADAIVELRRRAEELPLVYELFVVDPGGKLAGLCTLRDLLLNDAGTPLGTIMREPPATVTVGDKLREVAGAAAKYNLVSVPVVDDQGVLHGMVTVDDILAEVVDAR